MKRQEIDWDTLPSSADLFGEMYLAETTPDAEPKPDKPRDTVFQGLVICAIAAAAAAWLSEHYMFPIILLGLLIGLSMSFVARDPRSHMGLDFASRTCLRFGVVLLGLQVTFAQIGSLGPEPFAALAAIMTVTFLAGIVGARLVGQSVYTGILAGGATAICGASAALAMSLYPILAEYLNLTDEQAGFLIGASIHDVAQAIGGGYAFSEDAGSYAAIVKLSRVAMLAPVVIITGLLISGFDKAGGKAQSGPIWQRLALPWFIVAFFGVVLLNSLVAIPAPIRDFALSVSKGLLLIAVIATAMRSRLDLLMQTGIRPAIPVAIATVVSLLASFAAVMLIN